MGNVAQLWEEMMERVVMIGHPVPREQGKEDALRRVIGLFLVNGVLEGILPVRLELAYQSVSGFTRSVRRAWFSLLEGFQGFTVAWRSSKFALPSQCEELWESGLVWFFTRRDDGYGLNTGHVTSLQPGQISIWPLHKIEVEDFLASARLYRQGQAEEIQSVHLAWWERAVLRHLSPKEGQLIHPSEVRDNLILETEDKEWRRWQWVRYGDLAARRRGGKDPDPFIFTGCIPDDIRRGLNMPPNPANIPESSGEVAPIVLLPETMVQEET